MQSKTTGMSPAKVSRQLNWFKSVLCRSPSFPTYSYSVPCTNFEFYQGLLKRELKFLKDVALALYFVLSVVRTESLLWAQPGNFLTLVLRTGGPRNVLHSAVLGVLHA